MSVFLDFVTPPNSLRLEALIPIKFWSETDKVSPKTGQCPGLEPYKICLQRRKSQRTVPQLNGHTPEFTTRRITHLEYSSQHT